MAEDKKAKRARQAAERRAWRKAREEAWQLQVEQHFSYLQHDFGFRIVDVEFDSWVTRVVYRSSTTAIYIDRNVEYNRVEVSLIRLVEGKIPANPIFFSSQAPFYQTLLDNVLIVRAPQVDAASHAFKGLSDEQIEKALAFWAKALRLHAEDILRGNFTIFDDVKALIQERVRQHPRQITIWTPEGAPPEQGQALAKAADPGIPEVTVEIRQYSRPKPQKRAKSAKNAEQP